MLRITKQAAQMHFNKSIKWYWWCEIGNILKMSRFHQRDRIRQSKRQLYWRMGYCVNCTSLDSRNFQKILVICIVNIDSNNTVKALLQLYWSVLRHFSVDNSGAANVDFMENKKSITNMWISELKNHQLWERKEF